MEITTPQRATLLIGLSKNVANVDIMMQLTIAAIPNKCFMAGPVFRMKFKKILTESEILPNTTLKIVNYRKMAKRYIASIYIELEKNMQREFELSILLAPVVII